MKDTVQEVSEVLLDMWKDGKYIEVSTLLGTAQPRLVVKFCSLLIKYDGVNQVHVLEKFLD